MCVQVHYVIMCGMYKLCVCVCAAGFVVAKG